MTTNQNSTAFPQWQTLEFWKKWRFVAKENLYAVFIFLAFIFIFSCLSFYFGDPISWFKETDKFALLFDLALLFALFFVGLNQYRVEWENNLPNYLTVTYCFEGQVHIKVEMIPLSSLGDLRPQAQSIIQALNDGRASLYPMMNDIKHGVIVEYTHHDGKTEIAELHTAVINLTHSINDQAGKLSTYGVNTETEYLYWIPPFNNQSLIRKDYINNTTHAIEAVHLKSKPQTQSLL